MRSTVKPTGSNDNKAEGKEDHIVGEILVELICSSKSAAAPRCTRSAEDPCSDAKPAGIPI